MRSRHPCPCSAIGAWQSKPSSDGSSLRRDGDQAGFQPRAAIPGELQRPGDLDQADDVLGGDVVDDVVAGSDDDPVAGLRDAALVPGLLRGPGAGLRGSDQRAVRRRGPSAKPTDNDEHELKTDGEAWRISGLIMRNVSMRMSYCEPATRK